MYHEQGPFLKSLSQVVEPALTALVTEDIASQALFPIERVDMEIVGQFPKGSVEFIEYLVPAGSGN